MFVSDSKNCKTILSISLFNCVAGFLYYAFSQKHTGMQFNPLRDYICVLLNKISVCFNNKMFRRVFFLLNRVCKNLGTSINKIHNMVKCGEVLKLKWILNFQFHTLKHKTFLVHSNPLIKIGREKHKWKQGKGLSSNMSLE